ncbi:ATP-grasp peptide maturase system methyltransferase [Streptomyces sp. UNOC14_S4]|uniref:ATP-grasp peptide maturase system methyltransferase n=1 Tax=Streptomyces sp. UNOC14_S4 TaxID=2872340 RepID=UPI001E299D0A|nr:ATP-grasp peptide maturase system methyltransferase [Streptomyces sp. UNOC14_S4]MCC3768749.1 ATP-grasp peptide maturase system methyltransferase [Streptomyces sp. UNOC14_S4]
MTNPTTLRRSLAAAITTDGSMTDPAWRTAIETVPRELFLGDAVYRMGHGERGTLWEPVHRSEMTRTEWLELVYTNDTWVTQVDGIAATDAAEPIYGTPTSSSTLPSLVVRMLEAADIHDGDKVLEIGTGTGYSTAILCHRLGEKNVVSIEYDPMLAALAADRIHAAGHNPTLVTGDGLEGWEDEAEYDCIVATCAVRTIPRSWIWQTSVGGIITATLGGWMEAHGLACLTVGEDGSATGRFTGETISYMLARPHRRPPRSGFYRHSGQSRITTVNPELLQDWTGRFVAQLASPSAEFLGSGGNVVLLDVATGSQAWTEPAADGWTVHQHGPLNLWDQVETALRAWQNAGSPDQSAFGMTITPDHTQSVWIGTPDGPSWQLPA